MSTNQTPDMGDKVSVRSDDVERKPQPTGLQRRLTAVLDLEDSEHHAIMDEVDYLYRSRDGLRRALAVAVQALSSIAFPAD